MHTKAKKTIKITAIVLAVWLFICVVLAGWIVLPELNKKGRYKTVKNFANGKVEMIAHRGLSGLALENTLWAFEEAGKRAYDGIETDVQVTKDGKFVVFHDGDLSRWGIDLDVQNTDFYELRRAGLHDLYDSENTQAYTIPTLKEYIQVCVEYDKQAILELKNAMSEEQVWEIAQTVKDLGWWDRTTFISMRREHLLALRENYPDASAQYVVERASKDDIAFLIEHKIDADFCWVSINPFRVRKLHKAGLKVNCWTVDTRACAWYMRFCGVDMLTTNILM